MASAAAVTRAIKCDDRFRFPRARHRWPRACCFSLAGCPRPGRPPRQGRAPVRPQRLGQDLAPAGALRVPGAGPPCRQRELQHTLCAPSGRIACEPHMPSKGVRITPIVQRRALRLREGASHLLGVTLQESSRADTWSQLSLMSKLSPPPPGTNVPGSAGEPGRNLAPATRRGPQHPRLQGQAGDQARPSPPQAAALQPPGRLSYFSGNDYSAPDLGERSRPLPAAAARLDMGVAGIPTPPGPGPAARCPLQVPGIPGGRKQAAEAPWPQRHPRPSHGATCVVHPPIHLAPSQPSVPSLENPHPLTVAESTW